MSRARREGSESETVAGAGRRAPVPSLAALSHGPATGPPARRERTSRRDRPYPSRPSEPPEPRTVRCHYHTGDEGTQWWPTDVRVTGRKQRKVAIVVDDELVTTYRYPPLDRPTARRALVERALERGHADIWNVNGSAYRSPSRCSEFGPVREWDVSEIDDMARLFQDITLHHFPYDELAGWDTSLVRKLDETFQRAVYDSGATRPPLFLSRWDVSNVWTMQQTFDNARMNVDIGGWDVSNVELTTRMFRAFDGFDMNLSDWNLASVRSMDYMFLGTRFLSPPQGAGSVASLGWLGMEACTSMRGVFNGCFFGTSPVAASLASWNVSNVEDMSNSFFHASCAAVNVPAIDGWNVGSVETMRGMFWLFSEFSLPLVRWDVGRVTDMFSMFNGARSFHGDLSLWKTTSLENAVQMFKDARSFQSDLSAWSMTRVTDMTEMFSGATRFRSDLSRWDLGMVGEKKMARWLDGAKMFGPAPVRTPSQHYAEVFRAIEEQQDFDWPVPTWTLESVERHVNHYYKELWPAHKRLSVGSRLRCAVMRIRAIPPGLAWLADARYRTPQHVFDEHGLPILGRRGEQVDFCGAFLDAHMFNLSGKFVPLLPSEANDERYVLMHVLRPAEDGDEPVENTLVPVVHREGDVEKGVYFFRFWVRTPMKD